MNILPHKTFHVWRPDNLLKVRRDELKHEKEEAEKKRKRDLVAQERRLEALRKRAHDSSQSHSAGINISADPVRKETQHVNFFETLDVEDGKYGAEHPDVVREKKAKQLWEQKKASMYLGQSAAEQFKLKPWYHRKGARGEAESLRRDDPNEARVERMQRKRAAWRKAEDPLAIMNAYLHQSPSSSSKPKASPPNRSSLHEMKIQSKEDLFSDKKRKRIFTRVEEHRSDGKSSSPSRRKEKRERRKLDRKHRKKEEREGKKRKRARKSHKRNSLSKEDWMQSRDDKRIKWAELDALNRERLARESKERHKAESLLLTSTFARNPSASPLRLPDGRTYHSQFVSYHGGRVRAPKSRNQ